MVQSNELMLSREEVQKAAKQWFIIKNKYPEFCKMFLMISELNKGPSIQEIANELVAAEEANKLRKAAENIAVQSNINNEIINNIEKGN